MASYADIKKALGKGVGAALGAAAEGGKKKGGGFYSEKWQPPRTYTDDKTSEKITEPSEPIALLNGHYRIDAKTKLGEEVKWEYPFYMYYDHYNSSKGVKRRSCSCSAGLIIDLDDAGRVRFDYGEEPCVPCYYIDQEGAGGKDGWIRRSRKAVFTCVVLKWFHTTKVDNKTEFKACTGKKCPLCQKGFPRQFGRRVFWAMGPVWAEYILEKNQLFQNSCSCGGELEYLGFTCPECNHIIKDFEHEEADAGTIEYLRTSEIKCPKCKKTIEAVPVVECNECDDPQLVDLWSVAMKPRRIGAKFTPDLESWRPLKENEIEAVSKFEPIDFSKFLKPADPAKQAEWYGVKNPFAEDTSGSDEWE